jgi:hypothetical protein
VLFNGTGRKLVGTCVGSSLIDSFVVGRDGRLTAGRGSLYTTQGLGPFGSEFRPADKLFVSNATPAQARAPSRASATRRSVS